MDCRIEGQAPPANFLDGTLRDESGIEGTWFLNRVRGAALAMSAAPGPQPELRDRPFPSPCPIAR